MTEYIIAACVLAVSAVGVAGLTASAPADAVVQRVGLRLSEGSGAYVHRMAVHPGVDSVTVEIIVDDYPCARYNRT